VRHYPTPKTEKNNKKKETRNQKMNRTIHVLGNIQLALQAAYERTVNALESIRDAHREHALDMSHIEQLFVSWQMSSNTLTELGTLTFQLGLATASMVANHSSLPPALPVLYTDPVQPTSMGSSAGHAEEINVDAGGGGSSDDTDYCPYDDDDDSWSGDSHSTPSWLASCEEEGAEVDVVGGFDESDDGEVATAAFQHDTADDAGRQTRNNNGNNRELNNTNNVINYSSDAALQHRFVSNVVARSFHDVTLNRPATLATSITCLTTPGLPVAGAATRLFYN
jgi:hypothetical protein